MAEVGYRILGPVTLIVDGSPVPLGSEKLRVLLAVLLIKADEVVPRDRLIDALWGERPPETVRSGLNVLISRLRKVLGDAAIDLETHPVGYRLRVRPGQLDAAVFDQLVAAAREALGRGQPATAAARLREALALWRGAALADVAYEPFAQAEASRLEERRLAALEDRIDADLACGDHVVLVGELEALLAEHPLRERLHAQLMLALYRAGRQAEALSHYHQARQAFLRELAIEPGPALRKLEEQMLRHAAELDPPVREDAVPPAPVEPAMVPPTARRRRVQRRTSMIVAVGAVAVTIGATILGAGARDPRAPRTADRLQDDALLVVDPTKGAIVSSVQVGRAPAEVAVGRSGVWVLKTRERTVSRVDPVRRTVTTTIGTGGMTSDVAVGAGGVWVSTVEPRGVLHIDPDLETVVGTIRTGRDAAAPAPVAADAEGVWVAHARSGVQRISPTGDAVVDSFAVRGSGGGIALGFGSVWLPAILPNHVARLDLRSRRVTQIPFARSPSAIAVGAGAVWVAVEEDDQVWRIDPQTGSVTRTIRVGDGPHAIAYGFGGVWVANRGDGSLSRIDPATSRLVTTIPIGATPLSVAAGAGAVWVAAAAW